MTKRAESGIAQSVERMLDDPLEARLLEARKGYVVGLRDALVGLRESPGWRTLQDVVEAVPPAASVEVALLSLREEGARGRLYLVAASGVSARELSRLAFEPLSLAQARAVLASGGSSLLARELGVRWATGFWLKDGPAIGTLFAGCRTRRLPLPEELAGLREAAETLGGALGHFDRAQRRLRRRAAALAREQGLDGAGRRPLRNLRAREVQILELYGDGLGTAEIAELLVISPHTVRTHVRNALRRLDVRSRQEAVAQLGEWQVLRMLDAERDDLRAFGT
ncbi:MAG TPA: helix-turn-helix transcriptional regulator [Gaiellaceae bacterium]|nr:helix-turn-helix transcriptional regulator [Gaiellaceae bacterium]